MQSVPPDPELPDSPRQRHAVKSRAYLALFVLFLLVAAVVFAILPLGYCRGERGLGKPVPCYGPRYQNDSFAPPSEPLVLAELILLSVLVLADCLLFLGFIRNRHLVRQDRG